MEATEILPSCVRFHSFLWRVRLEFHFHQPLLVGGLEHLLMFFHLLGISSSQLTNSYLSEG